MSTGWADYVQRLMDAKGWSKSDLARAAGVDPSLVSNWTNRGFQPSVESLRKLSRVADVPMLHLMVAAGHLEPEEAAMEDVDITPRADVASVVEAIEQDPDLLPEAKRHLTSQYGLLLRITGKPASEPAGRPPLKAVARRGTPRAKRGPGESGKAT